MNRTARSPESLAHDAEGLPKETDENHAVQEWKQGGDHQEVGSLNALILT